MNRVGAVLISYNNSATMGAAVNSIAGQRGVERLNAVVLADDASADDSIARAHAAAPALALHVLATERNVGAWPNLNRALHHMCDRVDWALLLHADDVAVPGWLAALLERIDRCADDVASISTSWDMLYGERVHETGERQPDEVRVIAGTSAAVHDTLLRGCWWKISGAAIRCRAFLAVGDFDRAVPQCADWDWSLRALAAGWSFEYLPRALTLYRQHTDALSSSALRHDVDIRDALTMIERYGRVLGRGELTRFYGRRAGYALRRMLRGAWRADGQRVRTSLRTFALLGRHLSGQLPA